MRLDARHATNVLLLCALALVPVYVALGGSAFYLSLFTRVVILALAAVSLNLILGYGGMVSFGHAAYIGVGGYSVGILASHGIYSGALQWPLAIALSSLLALAIGAISLRTRGVYFIMITLAFGQMVYFLGAGAYAYGGDDGLTIHRRSQFGGLLDLGNKTVFYYLCFILLLAAIYFCHRLVRSRFGMVICASRSNDRRTNAIGFPTYRYRLAAFVIAGAVCGLAGVLLANHGDFVSPAAMHWTRSGDLIVMVVLGGMGTLFGPLYGTVAFLLLEELMSSHLPKPLNESWQIFFGPMLVLVVLFAKGGIDSLLARAGEARG